jgi:hypothetical protein
MTLSRMGEFLWQAMPEGKEKYHAYLCSQQWAEKRQAVLKRCKSVCERCGLNEVEQVHHLTYIRKYNERLEDLAGWCRLCHEHNHDPSKPDPLAISKAQLALPRPLIIDGSDRCFDGSVVKCPYCECECCHFNGEPEHVGDSKDGNQGRLTVPMYCECGHKWDMVFAGHKGTMTAFTRNAKELPPPYFGD